ncbi:unnamed protein product [Prorocentrum cordatum]|uniref:Kinetochore protein Spc24 n=1 Tax=Prorocentrum cordatum TaxID=2364126 RepID=A0ABN9WF77_9DINO|nr:unnamed protein product [Polarella glacialis]
MAVAPGRLSGGDMVKLLAELPVAQAVFGAALACAGAGCAAKTAGSLVAAAARGALQGAQVAGGSDGDAELAVGALDGMQAILADVGVKGVSEAKACLRDAGRADLASRLARFSKVRNGVAHRDVRLAGDIGAAVKAKANGGGELVTGAEPKQDIGIVQLDGETVKLRATVARLESELAAARVDLAQQKKQAKEHNIMSSEAVGGDSAEGVAQLHTYMRVPFVEGLSYPKEETGVRAQCLAALLAHGSAGLPPEQCERIACQPDFDNVKRYLASWS